MTTKPPFEEYDEIETGRPIGGEQVQNDPTNRPPGGMPGGDGRPRKLPPGRRKELAAIAAADRARRRASEADVDDFGLVAFNRAKEEG